MNTTAFARRSSIDPDPEDFPPEAPSSRGERWSDRLNFPKPLAVRHDLEKFQPVGKRAANDDGTRARSGAFSPDFVGSRYFWAAMIATGGFCLVFAALMGFRSAETLGGLLRNPMQHGAFILSLVVIAAVQWIMALSAHRQAVSQEMWRRLMAVTQRMGERAPAEHEAARALGVSLDSLVNELDQRIAALDERTATLSEQITGVIHETEASAAVNVEHMRSIAEATEAQRDSLQRIGATISTEVLPVIAKLESTVEALDHVSQHAGGILGSVGAQLQQSTGELQSSLDQFNRANFTIAPELEKRVARFEATMSRLPDQLESMLSRLNPLSDTMADAAALSTANAEVMEQIGRDITNSLQSSRALFQEFGDSNTATFRQAVDDHVERFRDMLAVTVDEEVSRLSAISRELNFVAELASSLVEKLNQPVNEVSAAANRTLADMDASVEQLNEKVQKSLSNSVVQLNNAASQIVAAVSREIESSTIALQTRLAASSNDLVQRVNIDAAHFEGVIDEAAEKTAVRVAGALHDLSNALSHRMESEIAKVDGSLRGSIIGLSDQMRSIIDGIPSRLTTMTRETIQALENNLERSFEGVANRSERLNEQFKKNATETAEAVLDNYVEFIFLAIERFRAEMTDVNGAFHQELEAKLRALPDMRPEVAATTVTPAPADGPSANEA
jgi:hypothetical protein